MSPIKARSRKPMIVRCVDRIDELPRFGGIEHRRLAAPHDVERPAHGGGRIGRHDLAYHHPVEQVPQRGQAQLRGRCGSLTGQFLDVGRDMNARDLVELRHALRRQPVEKLLGRACVGAARVRVANLGGEEFEEAIGSTGAGRGDEGGGVSGGDGRELVHLSEESKNVLRGYHLLT